MATKHNSSRPIKVGIDFDGVLAYNPFRVIRAPVTYVKRRFFGMKKTHFHIPKTRLEQAIWGILHESSVFPAQGVGLLQELIGKNLIEAHLLTARYSFLEKNLMDWLARYRMTHLFRTININRLDEQPHMYKERMIKALGFDIFIEDNWDIVEHLQGKTGTKVYWIYNITDKSQAYPHKYPYLEKALRDVKTAVAAGGRG